MNTLEELNTYSNSQIPFVDDRSLIITTATTNTTTQSVTIVEDAAVDLSTFGVTFGQLRSLDNATPDHITLEFDFSAALNPSVVWPTKDAFIEGNTEYNNIIFSSPTPGVFVADKIQLNSDYLAVLANSVVVARDQVAVYSYTITVSWPGNTFTQQFDVTTIPSAETNLNGLSLTARALGQHLLFDPSLTPRPAIVDASPDSTYELEFTSTAGATLATTQGNTPTTSITLSGDKDAVNTALQNVRYSPLNGFFQQTDTINYTLTVTNPSIGSPYVSETGSFDNFVPAFGEVFGITGRSVNTSITQDLFASPYPYVEDSIGSNLIQLTITTTVGQIKQSSTSGSFSNTLSLTGNSATLSTALQLIQYKPVIALGTTTDTLNYVLTWSGFTLDTGSWLHETVINTNVNNLNGISISSTDIYEYDLFTSVTPQPTITGTDTNTDYQLNLTYNNIGKIDSNIGSVGYSGSLSTITTNLQAATFLPGDQDLTATVSYELLLENISVITGSFSITNPAFFEFVNWPSTIAAPSPNKFYLFDGFNPEIIDQTGGAESVDLTMSISGGSLFADPTDPTDPSKYRNTFTFTNTASDLTTFLQDTGAGLGLEVEPADVVPGETHVISYSLSYPALGQTYQSGTIDLEVPAYVELLRSDNVTRSYTENTVENFIFQTGGAAPELIDRVDPTRIYTLTFTSSVNTRLARQSDTFPYNNSTISLNGTPATINAVLSSPDPIKFIPDVGSTTTETITWQLYDNLSALVTSGTITVDGVARTTPIAGEGVYTLNGTGTTSVTVTEEMVIYGQIDVLINSASGDGGYLDSIYSGGFGTGGSGGQELAASSSGGDGGLIHFQNQNVFSGNILPGESLTMFDDGFFSIFQHDPAGPAVDIIRVRNGGEGGAGDASQSTTDGRPGINSGGGGAYWIDSPNPIYPGPWYTSGSAGNTTPSTWSPSYFSGTPVNIGGNTGTDGSANTIPSPYAIAGVGGTSTSYTSDITGTNVTYRTVGGSGGEWDGTTLTQPTNGQPGISVLRIKQR